MRLISKIIVLSICCSVISCSQSVDNNSEEKDSAIVSWRDTGLVGTAKSFIKKKDADSVHFYLNKALMSPDYEKMKDEIYNLISLTYLHQRNNVKAMDYLDSAIKFAPDSGKYCYYKFLMLQKDSSLNGDYCQQLLMTKKLNFHVDNLDSILTAYNCSEN